MITLVSCAIGALGAGAWSLDHAAGFSVHGWAGLAVAVLAGAGGAGLLLATSWRPASVSGSKVAKTVKNVILFYF
jgi:putative oxidoreductase